MGDYDNIYLVPKGISNVLHRGDVDLVSDFYNFYPIMSSPMKGVSGPELVVEMVKNNCFGILHRFDTYQKRMENIETIGSQISLFGIAIGLNGFDAELKIAKYAYSRGAEVVCLDIANGYLSSVGEAVKVIKEELPYVKIMAGNVITYAGAEYLRSCGCDLVRVGIGNGGLCSTRDQTGVGRNNLAALKDCAWTDINLVADGGISKPGNAVKAFYCGADFVMLGSALMYANETENKDGHFYGMASKDLHNAMGKEVKSIEGKSIYIPPEEKKPLKEILDQYLWGIRSACTYGNCKSYKYISHNFIAVPVNELVT